MADTPSPDLPPPVSVGSLASNPTARIPEQKPAEQPEIGQPGGLAFAAALGREMPTGELWQHMQQAFEPGPPAAKGGYDPIPDIPPDIPLEWHDHYLHLTSPASVAVKASEDRAKLNDGATIARHGVWGVAAGFGLGLTDPMNIAAMALVPEAQVTRVGNAIRYAMVNAATTAGQDFVSAATGGDETLAGSALNVSASAILGGVLGSVAHRVPKDLMEKMAAAAHGELHAPAPSAENPALLEDSKVAGPERRSVLEEVEQGVEKEVAAREEGAIPGVERRALTYVPPRPEGPTVPRPGTTPEIEPHRMSLMEALAVSRGAEARSGGLSAVEAVQQGLDPEEVRLARFGSRNVFTKGGMGFDEAAEMLSQHGYPVVDENGKYSPNSLLEALDAEMRGKKQYSLHATDYLAAIEEHERASERADRIASGELPPEEKPAEEKPAEEKLAEGATEFNVEELERENQEALEKLRAEAKPLPGEPLYEPPQEEVPPAIVNPSESQSMGAAQAGLTKADLTIARGGRAYSKTVGIVAPAARLIDSASVKVRQLLTELVDLKGTMEMHHQGKATPGQPIEGTLWKEIDGKQAMADTKANETYADYRKRMREEGQQPLSRDALEGEIAHALRNGDVSSIPEAQEHAKWFRKNVFDPWYERRKAAGPLPEDATGPLFAKSYFTRVFDMKKIRGDRPGWIEFLRQHFIKEGMDPAEAGEIAHRVDGNVGGAERGLTDTKALDGIVPRSGRMKGRKLTIDDNVLEPWLSNDLSLVTHAYLRTMVPEVLFMERFEGDRNLEGRIGEIRDDYAHMMEQARAQNDGKRMNALFDQMKSHVGQIEKIRDSLYGIYGVPKDPGYFLVRAGRFLRGLDVQLYLGAATLKHAPDLGNVIQQFGTPNTLKVIAGLLTSIKGRQLAFREAQRLGVAIDMTNRLGGLDRWDAGVHSQFPEQKVLRAMNKFFTVATGETPLITWTQGVAATLAHDDILRTAQRVARDGYDTVAKSLQGRNRLAALNASGIDEAMLQRIHAAATAKPENMQTFRGIRVGMSETWSDQGAARALEWAVERASHSSTMRPSIGDKPFAMQTEWGKLLMQFRSVEFAMNRVVGLPMMQGLAHGDVRAMQGLAAQFMMAGLGYAAYQWATGRKVETENPRKMLAEIMDRTNLLGWTSNLIYPLLGKAGISDMARWYDKDPVSYLGPGAETLKNVFANRITGAGIQGIEGLVRRGMGMTPLPSWQKPVTVTRQDLHAMRKLVPYNQVWYARRAFDHMENMMGSWMNLPGKPLGQEKTRETPQ